MSRSTVVPCVVEMADGVLNRQRERQAEFGLGIVCDFNDFLRKSLVRRPLILGMIMGAPMLDLT